MHSVFHANSAVLTWELIAHHAGPEILITAELRTWTTSSAVAPAPNAERRAIGKMFKRIFCGSALAVNTLNQSARVVSRVTGFIGSFKAHGDLLLVS